MSTFYTPEGVAGLALALLEGDLVHGATVERRFQTDYRGGVGTSITIRKPSILAARERAVGATAAITADAVAEDTDSLTLTSQIYSAVDMPDADLTLNLEDFGRQVLAPQIASIARRIESKVVAEMQGLTQDGTLTAAYDSAKPSATLFAARKSLRDALVPVQGLYAAVGTQVMVDLLSEDLIVKANESGSASALRDAMVGKIAGMSVYESNGIAEDEIVVYSQSAFALALVAPKVPEGAGHGAGVSSNGFAMTAIRDYDPNTLQDRSVVSAFVGTKTFVLDTVALDDTTGTVTPAVRIGGAA
jgi:hypothetical protein